MSQPGIAWSSGRPTSLLSAPRSTPRADSCPQPEPTRPDPATSVVLCTARGVPAPPAEPGSRPLPVLAREAVARGSQQCTTGCSYRPRSPVTGPGQRGSARATQELLPIDDRTVDLAHADHLPRVIDGPDAEGHTALRRCRRLGADVDASAQRRRAPMRDPHRDANRRLARVEHGSSRLDGRRLHPSDETRRREYRDVTRPKRRRDVGLGDLETHAITVPPKNP